MEEPGGFYHLVSRGSNKQRIFFDDLDRMAFIDRLGRVVRRYGWVVYAYCLMTTHYHLVVEIPLCGLSRGMQVLNGGFSRRTSARYGRVAHLFQNRFFSQLIEEEAHLFAACRYIVLNPVAAGICDRPEEWRWSSYRACAGLGQAPAALATGPLLDLFAADAPRARVAYSVFVAAGVDEALAARERLKSKPRTTPSRPHGFLVVQSVP